ncbi:unnamed protein product, partial [Ectocarpus fasciculatus]
SSDGVANTLRERRSLRRNGPGRRSARHRDLQVLQRGHLHRRRPPTRAGHLCLRQRGEVRGGVAARSHLLPGERGAYPRGRDYPRLF